MSHRVRFEFEVDDIDAHNILDCIRWCALKNDEQVLDCMADENMPEGERYWRIKWLRENRDYKLSLIDKMTNRRVKTKRKSK